MVVIKKAIEKISPTVPPIASIYGFSIDLPEIIY